MKLLKTALVILLAGLQLAAPVLTPSPARAEGAKAGDFDYYVMALSWSAGWCAAEGNRRAEPQCDPGRGLTFILHGLWPQYEKGWPSFCRTGARDPARAMTAEMADLMGGAGSAFHQWKKHGRCTGLSAKDYFALSRRAFATVEIPPVFEKISKPITLPAEVIEQAFLDSNPGLKRDQVTVTCQDKRIREVRICLTRDLEPRRCGEDVIRDCRLKDALLDPVR